MRFCWQCLAPQEDERFASVYQVSVLGQFVVTFVRFSCRFFISPPDQEPLGFQYIGACIRCPGQQVNRRAVSRTVPKLWQPPYNGLVSFLACPPKSFHAGTYSGAIIRDSLPGHVLAQFACPPGIAAHLPWASLVELPTFANLSGLLTSGSR